MSEIDIEKAEVQHQELQAAESTSPNRKTIPVAPTSELVEFQKTLIGPAIGFGAFGLSSFVLGLYNTGLLTDVPQVAVGVAFGYGAIGQFIAAVIEIVHKNPFSAASFSTFASFFVAFGIMFVPASGFMEAAVAAGQLNYCMGLIEIAYAMSALVFFLGTFRQPVIVRLILGLAFLCYFLSAIGSFTGSVGVTKAGGWFSFILGLVAWYALCASIYNETNTFIRVPFF